MGALLTPARRRGSEILDRPDVDPRVVTRSMRDVALANRLFGGRRAALVEIDRALDGVTGEVTLLDVGTGLGDIPAAARTHLARRGVRVRAIGLDLAPELASAARPAVDDAVCASAFAIPLRDRSVDVVLASQMLHHFPEPEARMVLAELHRVARRRVIVSDLRRSWLAAAGIWLASWALGFHPVSRHDGVVSVLRGFTADDLGALVRGAVGATPDVARRLGWRLTASWGVEA